MTDVVGNWKFHSSSRIEICAPSMTGKTKLLLKLLRDTSVWEKDFKRVIYCAPLINEEQDLIAELSDICINKKLLLLDRLPTIEEINKFRNDEHCILALDDVMLFDSDNSHDFLQKLVLLYSHHYNISTIYCVQNPYLKSKKKIDLVSLSRNLTARIVMYQLNDYFIYNLMSSRIFPGKKHFLTYCLETAKQKYNLNYVVINVNSFSNLPRQFICYTAIFEDERKKFFDSPIFFDLENYDDGKKKVK